MSDLNIPNERIHNCYTFQGVSQEKEINWRILLLPLSPPSTAPLLPFPSARLNGNWICNESTGEIVSLNKEIRPREEEIETCSMNLAHKGTTSFLSGLCNSTTHHHHPPPPKGTSKTATCNSQGGGSSRTNFPGRSVHRPSLLCIMGCL